MNMPDIGFGTYKLKGDECKESVEHALNIGYRAIDTAARYENEKEIGEVLSESNIPRNELFITSKLSPYDMTTPDHVYNCAIESMKNLKTDYLDLYLIHWPVPFLYKIDPKSYAPLRASTWKVLERLKKENKVRHIGVSNFMVKHLKSLLDICEIKPFINQFEYHPFLDLSDLISLCEKNDILVEAYGSLGRGDPLLLSHEKIMKVAKKYNKDSSQILLRWAIDQNIKIIPKSKTKSRISSNFDVFDFKLTEEEVNDIKKISKSESKRYIWDPNLAN